MKGGIELLSWFIGAQLIGVVVLLVGYIQYRWPPKKINNLYGYRTATAMKNQETWDEANHYSALLMMKVGAVLIALGFTISAIINMLPITQNIKGVLMVMPCIAAGMGSAIVMMVKTEKHLAKTFDDKQK